MPLEVLRLFAEIAKLPIIIIVDIPQEVKDAPKGRRGAYSTPPSVGQFFRTEEPSLCLLGAIPLHTGHSLHDYILQTIL